MKSFDKIKSACPRHQPISFLIEVYDKAYVKAVNRGVCILALARKGAIQLIASRMLPTIVS